MRACHQNRMRRPIAAILLCLSVLVGTSCAKQVRFQALPLLPGGSASVKVNLTFDRNNQLEVKLSNVPEPSSVKPESTRYVLWAATPDRQHVSNLGQLRLDQDRNAQITTLTPLRSFVLFVTAEPAGDVMTPGPHTVFESRRIEW